MAVTKNGAVEEFFGDYIERKTKLDTINKTDKELIVLCEIYHQELEGVKPTYSLLCELLRDVLNKDELEEILIKLNDFVAIEIKYGENRVIEEDTIVSVENSIYSDQIGGSDGIRGHGEIKGLYPSYLKNRDEFVVLDNVPELVVEPSPSG